MNTKDRALKLADERGVTVELSGDFWGTYGIDLTAPIGQAFEGGYGGHGEYLEVDDEYLKTHAAIWRAVIAAIKDLGPCRCGSVGRDSAPVCGLPQTAEVSA